MKMMKILSALIFVFFIFAGCGSGSDEGNDNDLNDDETPLYCEDSEGRKYNEGDRISDKCLAAMCRDGGWAENATTCYHCWGKEIGDKMEWICADGVTKVEWCECVEIDNETYGSEWKCIERADLNCPKE